MICTWRGREVKRKRNRKTVRDKEKEIQGKRESPKLKERKKEVGWKGNKKERERLRAIKRDWMREWGLKLDGWIEREKIRNKKREGARDIE